MIRRFSRLAAPLLLAASLLSCSAAPPRALRWARPPRPASGARPRPTARWWAGRLLAEMLAPSGAPEALQARAGLDQLKAEGMLASLGQGPQAAPPTASSRPQQGGQVLRALQGAHGSADPLAPMVGWFAANHLLTLDVAVPDLWKQAKPWVLSTLDAPGSIGWRARGELVEWWPGLEGAEANLSERAVVNFGCAREVRWRAPCRPRGRRSRWRSLPAESRPLARLGPRPMRTASPPGCSEPAQRRPGPRPPSAASTTAEPASTCRRRQAAGHRPAPSPSGSIAHKVMNHDLRIWGCWPR